MIDTLKWANRLKEAGIPEQQAYAYVEATVDAMRQAGYRATTDAGIPDAIELKAAIQSLNARLRALEDNWRALNEGCRQMMEEDRQSRQRLEEDRERRQREGEP